MDPLTLILGTIQSGEALPAALASIRSLRQKGGPGSADAAAHSIYLAYLGAATRVLADIDVLRAMWPRPSVVGALWTWPQYSRSLKDAMNDTKELAVVFAHLSVLGSDPVSEQAFDLAMTIADLQAALAERSTSSPDEDGYSPKRRAVNTALHDYVAEVRCEITGKELAAPDRGGGLTGD